MRPEPLVSVVTPLYNGEKYLAECIESVLAQTYRNWEHVVFNNLSKDRSLEIAEEYARKDPRLRVITGTEFVTAIPNWNNALRRISGGSKYVKFVHADDWLFPECLARMVALAEEHPSIGLVSAYRIAEDEVDLDGLPPSLRVVPGREVCRRALLDATFNVFGSPTSVLYRADLVRARATFFPEMSVHADTEVCFELLGESDLGFVHQVLTYTRRHNDSVSSKIVHYNTRLLGRWITLKRFGPIHLSDTEYRARLEKRLKSYYAFLARSVFALRDRDFWAYHRRMRAELEIPYRWLQAVRPLLAEGVKRLLHPLRTARELARALRERRRAAAARSKTEKLIP
jgi:glycosyltransferase involved in cell wall biosynthesis